MSARAARAPAAGARLAPAALVLLALVGCGDPPAPAPEEPARGSDRKPRDVDCVTDTHCVLMPYVTCCGECPPEPPFEAAPVEALDAVLIEAEQRCALDRRPCTPPVCTPRPPGCFVKAACVQARCVVESDGC